MQRGRDKGIAHSVQALGVNRSRRTVSFTSSSSIASIEDSDIEWPLPLSDANVSDSAEAWNSRYLSDVPKERQSRSLFPRPRRTSVVARHCPWPTSLRRLAIIVIGSAICTWLCARRLETQPHAGWSIAPSAKFIRAPVSRLHRFSRSRWRRAIPPWAPVRVAIYAGNGSDWEICTSVIHTMMRLELRSRSTLTLYIEDASGLKQSNLDRDVWAAMWPQMQLHQSSGLLAGTRNQHDAVIVVPSSPSTSVGEILPHLGTRGQVIFLIKCAQDFDKYILPRATTPEFTRALRDKRLVFVATDPRLSGYLQSALQIRPDVTGTAHRLESLPAQTGTLTPIRAMLPVARLPRASRPLSVTTFRPFRSNAVLAVSDKKANIDYINSLAQEFYDALAADPKKWGFTVTSVDNASRAAYSRIRGKSSSLHIILPPTASDTTKKSIMEKIRLPPGSGDMILVHNVAEISLLYQKLSGLHLFLPSFGSVSRSDDRHPFEDPIIALGLNLRVPVLLPHSLSLAYPALRPPAIITFPDNQDAKVAEERSMPIFEAVGMLKTGNDPRRRVASMARPWDKLDLEAKWNHVVRDIEQENVGILASAIGL